MDKINFNWEFREWVEKQWQELSEYTKLLNAFEKGFLYSLTSDDLKKLMEFIFKAIKNGELKLEGYEERKRINEMLNKEGS